MKLLCFPEGRERFEGHISSPWERSDIRKSCPEGAQDGLEIVFGLSFFRLAIWVRFFDLLVLLLGTLRHVKQAEARLGKVEVGRRLSEVRARMRLQSTPSLIQLWRRYL